MRQPWQNLRPDTQSRLGSRRRPYVACTRKLAAGRRLLWPALGCAGEAPTGADSSYRLQVGPRKLGQRRAWRFAQ
jgi:hypothetical protein